VNKENRPSYQNSFYYATEGLSIATAMVFSPLSTYTVEPVIAEAIGDTRNAAAFPTSSVQHATVLIRYHFIEKVA
jgi:ABC-type sulfate transport system permease component